MCEQNLVKYKLQINMWNKDLKLQNIYDNLYHHQGFFQINLTICEKWWYCSPRWTEGWSMRSRSWSIKLPNTSNNTKKPHKTLTDVALLSSCCGCLSSSSIPVAKCCHLVTILMTGGQNRSQEDIWYNFQIHKIISTVTWRISCGKNKI